MHIHNESLNISLLRRSCRDKQPKTLFLFSFPIQNSSPTLLCVPLTKLKEANSAGEAAK